MILVSKNPVRLLSARHVKFDGSEGKPVEYDSAKFVDVDTGVVFETTIAKDIASTLLKMENEDITASFEVLQGEKNKPKLRLVDYS